MLKQVLLVEDDEAGRVLMQEAFKEASLPCQLSMVNDGSQALRFLRRQGEYAEASLPELILLDLNLPGKSGLEILAEIKGEPTLQDVYIMILTGSNSPRDIEACSKFNCKYQLKPFQFQEVVDLIKSLPALVEK